MIDRNKIQPFLYPEWKFALALVQAFANSCGPGQIAFVFGPGGCGKTALAKYLEKTLYGGRESEPPGRLAVVGVEVDVVERGFFLSKSLMQDLVNATFNPFHSTPIAASNWAIDAEIKQGIMAHLQRRDRKSEPELRPIFVRVAVLLGVRLIIVDEANLLALTQRGRVPTDYLESLRRLADKVGCGLVLLGTIDMMVLMDHSGQINRRTMHIHLDRMRCDSEESKAAFLDFLPQLELDLDLPPGVLSENHEEVFDVTYGIPGEIVGLVERGEVRRVALGGPELKFEHLRAEAHLPLQRKRMRKEADLVAGVLRGIVSWEDAVGDLDRRSSYPGAKRRSGK